MDFVGGVESRHELSHAGGSGVEREEETEGELASGGAGSDLHDRVHEEFGGVGRKDELYVVEEVVA